LNRTVDVEVRIGSQRRDEEWQTLHMVPMHVREQTRAAERSRFGNLRSAVAQSSPEIEDERRFAGYIESDTGRVSTITTCVIAVTWCRTANTEERDFEFLTSPDALTLSPFARETKDEHPVTFVASESAGRRRHGYVLSMSKPGISQ
jgi:hypothetical protein